MFDTGSQLGNYTIERPLGQGGMARVFLARHSMLGTVHAIKVLDPSMLALPEVRSRFLSEGMIASKIVHPNIVRVTDALALPGVAGLVMEHIDGPNLEAYIKAAGGPLPIAQIFDLMEQILAGVGAAHAAGIIHRDLKPANVILAPGPDGRFVPKIADFGIAKVTDASQDIQKNATRAGSRMGTLSYMSPEQVRGAKDVSAQSDIFSLGATLYELATGTVAFDGDSDFEIMSKIVSRQHRDMGRLGANAALAPVILRALSPEPQLRYASCAEFADDLRRLAPATVPPVSRIRLPEARGSFPPPPRPSGAVTLDAPHVLLDQPNVVLWAGLCLLPLVNLFTGPLLVFSVYDKLQALKPDTVHRIGRDLVLTLATCGVYGLYAPFSVLKELHEAVQDQFGITLEDTRLAYGLCMLLGTFCFPVSFITGPLQAHFFLKPTRQLADALLARQAALA